MQFGLGMPNPLPSGLSNGSPGYVAAGTKWADILAVHTYSATGNAVLNNQLDATTHQSFGKGHEPYVADFETTWAHGFTGMSQVELNATPGIETEGGISGSNGRVNQGLQALNFLIEGFTGCAPSGGSAPCAQGNKLSSPYSLVDNDGGFTNSRGAWSASFHPYQAATWIGNMTAILNDTSSTNIPLLYMTSDGRHVIDGRGTDGFSQLRPESARSATRARGLSRVA